MRTRRKPLTIEVNWDEAFVIRTALRQHKAFAEDNARLAARGDLRNHWLAVADEVEHVLSEVEHAGPHFMAEDLLPDGPDVDVIA